MSCASTQQKKIIIPRDTETSRAAIVDIRERDRVRRTFQGLVSFRLGSKLFGAKTQMAALMQRPDNLRLEGQGEFGLNSVQVALHRGELTIYFPTQKRYFQRLATKDDLGRYLSLYLDPEDLLRILAGLPPVQSWDDWEEKKVTKNGVYWLSRADESMKVVRQGDRWYPVEYSRKAYDGTKDFTLKLSSYETASTPKGNTLFPMKSTLQFEDPRLRVDATYESVAFDVKAASTVFVIPIPEGTDVWDGE